MRTAARKVMPRRMTITAVARKLCLLSRQTPIHSRRGNLPRCILCAYRMCCMQEVWLVWHWGSVVQVRIGSRLTISLMLSKLTALNLRVKRGRERGRHATAVNSDITQTGWWLFQTPVSSFLINPELALME